MEPALRFVAALTSEQPVTIEDAKTQCRRALDFLDDDAWFVMAIAAARRMVEADTGLQLMNARYALVAREFPGEALRVPKAPLIAVESVGYVDTSGTAQTWAGANYLATLSDPGPPPSLGWVELAYGISWPTSRAQGNAVTVTFTAGFGTTGDAVPGDLRMAMLLLIGHWYETRGAVVVGTITKEVELAYAALVDHWRVYPLPVLV